MLVSDFLTLISTCLIEGLLTQMPSFKFTEIDGSRSVEMVPTFIRPFGVSAIRVLEENDESPLEMELQANDVLLDGKKKPGRATVNTKIVFNQPTTIYSLVRGGWVPMPFSIPPRFLVDRNVVISLRRIREGKIFANAQSLFFWTRFFAQGTGTFSPLPYAFEAGFRRKPTMSEFAAAYDEGVTELRNAIPNCDVIRLSEPNFRVAYALLEAFDRRSEQEISFLQAACPKVAQRSGRKNEWEVANAVVRLADQHKVNRASLASLAVLSCLFEDVHGNPSAIGRQVLKPKRNYSKEEAFNALSDLRHIEIAAACQGYFESSPFSLCTRDRALALLWSALSPRGKSSSGDSMELTFNLTEDLFSRLHEHELRQLMQLLRM